MQDIDGKFLTAFVHLKYAAPIRRWNPIKLKFLEKHFVGWTCPPNFREIRRAQQMLHILNDRSLPQIKTRAWALIKP